MKLKVVKKLLSIPIPGIYICLVGLTYFYKMLNFEFSDKEKQLFLYLKFHATLSTIFLVYTKVKAHVKLVMSKHIRDYFRKLSFPKVSNREGTLDRLLLC